MDAGSSRKPASVPASMRIGSPWLTPTTSVPAWRMLRRHAGTEVVGVSHGDPILILAGTLAGLRLEPASIFPQPYIATGVVYRLQFDADGACRDVQLLVPPFSPGDLATSSDDEVAA